MIFALRSSLTPAVFLNGIFSYFFPGALKWRCMTGTEMEGEAFFVFPCPTRL